MITPFDREKYGQHILNLDGKEYVTVLGRLLMAHATLPKGWSLNTELVKFDPTLSVVVFKATVTLADGSSFPGHAASYFGTTTEPIERSAYVETAETSAIGRALANAGIGLDVGAFASADELAKAIANRPAAPTTPARRQPTQPVVDPGKLLGQAANATVTEDGLTVTILPPAPSCVACEKPITAYASGQRTLTAEEVAAKSKEATGKQLCAKCLLATRSTTRTKRG